MFESTASIIPIQNLELSIESKSPSYNWKILAKAGLVFVGTTGVFCALKATGSFSLISSWLKNKEADFNEKEAEVVAIPGGTEGIETYSGYQRTDSSFVDFKSSETLRTDNLLPLTDFKAKRNPTEIPEKIGPEFRVNTYTISWQEYPSIAGLSDGKFVVTWSSYGQDGDSYGVYGQIFNANGTKFLSEFQVNTYITSHQKYPSMAGLSDGKFVVTWESQDGYSDGIYGQMFNADGNKYFSEFQVNTYTVSAQYVPCIVGLSNGKFAVTWESNGQDEDSYGVYGQIFNANGTKFLSEFQVNTYTVSNSHFVN